MGGGTLQLSSYGGQDLETIGNPQISFFKSVYKKHTNFAIESIQQFFDGDITNTQCKVSSTIKKNGDLIHKCFLDIKFPEFPAHTSNAGDINNDINPRYMNWTNATAYAYVKEASLFIGDLLIDKHISEWFDVWNELTDVNNKEHLFVNKHLAKNNYLKNNTYGVNPGCVPLQCYMPLQFWFNRHISSSLPLIALQYHDVKLQFTFRDLKHLVNTNGKIGTLTSNPEVKLFVDYIFLDVNERKQFAQNSHEFLIEQVQFRKSSLLNINPIKFNHPIKELIWICRNNNVSNESTNNINAVNNIVKSKNNSINSLSNGNDYFNYSTENYDSSRVEFVGSYPSNEPFSTCKLIFNGMDRFQEQKASYFRCIQPNNYHSKVSSKHIYNYSFSIKPEAFQPSGTCNFSRMKNPILEFKNITPDPTELIVFAVNYNILAIHAGMGGLKYSN